jgi:hypothetical protein
MVARGDKISIFFKISAENIKKSKWAFFNHLQQFIKKTSVYNAEVFLLVLKCINQTIHRLNEPWSFRKNDFEAGEHE